MARIRKRIRAPTAGSGEHQYGLDEQDRASRSTKRQAVGRLETSLETALRADPTLVRSAARALVRSNFPETVATGVLAAVGFDPEAVLGAADVLPDPHRMERDRRRDPHWPYAVLQGTGSARSAVSATYTARTAAGRAVYELHGRELAPRPGTPVPATGHVAWHTREVLKGGP